MRMRLTLLAASTAALLNTAGAVTVEEIVRPQRDAIAHCEDARAELARQGALRMKQLEEVKAWHQSLEQALADLIAFQEQEYERAKAAEALFVSRAASLVVEPGEQSWVPHIGWGIFGYFEKRRDDTNKAIAEAEGAIERGETQFNVQGVGWLSGKALKDLLAADAKAMADLQTALDTGVWQISYPGLGWVSGQSLAACRADNEKRIKALQEQVTKGEFQIHVVNLGWVTRNSLQAMIDGEEKRLKQLDADVAAMTLQINRAFFGWQTLAGVHSHMDKAKKDKAAYEAAAAATISYNVPSIGWTTGNDLDVAIARAEKEVAGVLQTAGEGKYAVPTGVGWLDMNAIQAALALPDCRPKDSPSPCLPPEHRPILQDGAARVPIAVDTDVAFRQQRIDLLKTYRAEIATLAQPRIALFDLDLHQWGRMQDEFTAEAGEHRKVIERKIKWLKEIMQTEIPGAGA
ncbi:MAG: hypothetical protein JNL56_05020 [Alphaproteobacteria bacterium]|nr:hypothetical protein [Alphaproteobacteria bacterium]